jgi:hypothetical protein
VILYVFVKPRTPAAKRPPRKPYKHKLIPGRLGAVQRRYSRVPEFAAELGLSPHTVWLWVRKGLIPSVKIGGAILLDTAVVQRLIEERYTREVVKV